MVCCGPFTVNNELSYEALKDLTRGKQKIDQKTIHQFIDALKVSAAVKRELKKITPHNYTGIQAPIPS